MSRVGASGRRSQFRGLAGAANDRAVAVIEKRAGFAVDFGAAAGAGRGEIVDDVGGVESDELAVSDEPRRGAAEAVGDADDTAVGEDLEVTGELAECEVA